MPIDSIRRVAKPKQVLLGPDKKNRITVRTVIRFGAGMVAGGLLMLLLFIGSVKVAALVGFGQGGASGHAGHPIQQPAAVTNGLVAWYPLDGNTVDQSSSGSNGTLNNFTFDGTTNGWAAGKFNKALLFNGSNTFVNLSNPSTLNFGTSDFTLSSWINFSTCSQQMILAKDTAGNLSNQFRFDISEIANNCKVGFAGSNSANSDGSRLESVSALSLNTWHHVLLTRTATNFAMYVDGALSNTATSTTTINFVSTYNFYIGGRINTSYFNGLIDDVRIYNRKLTSNEIGQLYQATQPINCDQSCVGWWKLNEFSGTSASDSSGNSNIGTLNNFTFGTSDGWTNAVFGNGLLFNSAQSVLSTIASPPVNDMTFSAWVYPTTGNIFNVFTLSTSAAGPQFFLRTGASNNMAWNVFNPAGGASEISSPVNSSPANQWSHLVVSRDSSGNRKMYLNGVLVLSDNYVPWRASVNQLYLGKEGTNASSFTGGMDDVRLYNRVLTSYEIYDQYSAGHSN